MAISVHWGTKVITVPQADLTPLGGGVYELDVDAFRLALKDLEDGEEGMPHLDTHRHNTEVTLSGATYARVVEIINGYTVTFEDGSYAVNLSGANNNIPDVMNVNGVSLRSFNSAGLIVSETGISGLTTEESARLTAAQVDAETARKMLTNREELSEGDTDNWVTYDDDDVTPLVTRSVTDKDGNVIEIPTGAPARRTS